MKVFIVEDSAIVRGRIIVLLSGIKGVEILGISGEESDALLTIRKLKPDMIILDIRLYKGNGIDLLEKIKAESPDTIVVILTNFPYEQYRERCLQLGADYFFDKSKDFDKIVDVVSERIHGRAS